MVNHNKKAISPVVATALLLVVAVVAVVGFQTWFTSYQSGLNVKVTQESDAGSAVTISRLENGTVYIKNAGNTNITGASVSVSPTTGYSGSCTDNTSVTLAKKDVTTVNLPGCSLTEDSVYNVVVVTSSGVFDAEMIAN